MIHPTTRPGATTRRGMLLLLVLSILALFIVVGAVGILVALRARQTARAFAAASASQSATGALARVQLDEALLKLIRGPSQPAAPGTPARDVTESLLEDKYGAPQPCTVTALSGAASAFMTATVTGLDLSNPAAVAGRVLTFVPAASDPTGPTSYRILRANAATNAVLLANVKPNTPLPVPTVFPCDAVVNGREFVAEPYDAFDDQNTFLTQPVLQKSTIVSVARPAFGAPGTPCTVDNDGDGIADGIWLDNVLPPQRSSEGGTLSFAVSYLVLDLDGRINLNAHGSFVRAQAVASTATYPRDPNLLNAGNVPVGMGFGPADVDASLLVATQAEATSGAIPARWALLLLGGTVTRNAAVSTGSQWRPTPAAETVQQGRYTQCTMSGTVAAPGNASLTTGTNPANADFWLSNPLGNSPTDLKARLQVFTEGTPPILKFARPAGAVAWVSGTDVEDLRAAGATAHPYALRLDEDAPRAAGPNAAIDAPYTVGELERILRPFDADAAGLAPRLAAMLDDLAERSRMTVTTDSWDTPAVTGTTATRLGTAVTGGNAFDVLSPETVAGLRFNVNRPLVSAAARQDYFRQLYTLGVALGVPAADAAQWAANVIEFRDPDSIMTWYPYDTNPLDGVWTTGTGVWGMERPELVISSASASGSQVTVSLYRPWNAQLCAGNTSTATGTTERIDAGLGAQTANTLDPARQSGTDSVWRIATSSTAVGLATLFTTATSVGANAALNVPPFNAADPAVIRLERLADPTRARDTNPANAAYNDYVPVHRVNTPQDARTVSRWLHWPNRDLVSHAELMAVPAGDPAAVAEALFDESKEASPARSTPAILEATIVPSRFAGANVLVASGSTFLAGTGYENFSFGQFSRWREAGRVNVNTILPNTGNDSPVLDNAVWTAVLGRTGVPNPVTPQAAPYSPIKADRDLLVAGGDAIFPRSGAEAASAFLKRSTAIRLANVATIRSHVFAVWVTVRITDSSPNAGPPQFARVFAIVDRSIPAACSPGRTLNARETIRLQRFLQ